MMPEKDFAYECMAAARKYVAQAKDMERHADAAMAGDGADEKFRKQMTMGVIILAEQIGVERACGMADADASNQIREIMGALVSLYVNDLKGFHDAMTKLF